MAAQHRHADARAADPQRRIVKDFAAFVLQLHFLRAVTLFIKAADLGDQIVRDLNREGFRGRGLSRFQLGDLAF